MVSDVCWRRRHRHKRNGEQQAGTNFGGTGLRSKGASGARYRPAKNAGGGQWQSDRWSDGGVHRGFCHSGRYALERGAWAEAVALEPFERPLVLPLPHRVCVVGGLCDEYLLCGVGATTVIFWRPPIRFSVGEPIEQLNCAFLPKDSLTVGWTVRTDTHSDSARSEWAYCRGLGRLTTAPTPTPRCHSFQIEITPFRIQSLPFDTVRRTLSTESTARRAWSVSMCLDTMA